MSRISKRLRPSPAAVIAVLALVFALSGVAVALPGKNTVATKDIKKNAVTAAKIKDGAVTTGKLGNDAVTGAKVNEATLGKVPSAGTADTASKATTADAAAKATEATKATTANNALEFDGRTLAQVRPLASGTTDTTGQGLEDSGFETVIIGSITLPTGGADVVLNATLELDNNSGVKQSGTCRLRFDGTLEGSDIVITMPEGDNQVMALATFVNNAGAGSNPVLVECQGSGADDAVRFENGDLTIQAFPIGA